MIEQVPGDVGEDHPSGVAESFQRTERDEAVTDAHIGQRVAGPRLRCVEHLVADRVQVLGEVPLAGLGIAAVSDVQ